MKTDTIIHESAVQRQWRLDGNLRYDVVMNIIIIILNVVAILHMTTMGTNKIPVDLHVVGPLIVFGIMYPTNLIVNFLLWMFASVEEYSLPLSHTYFVGRLSHTLGFCVFLCLLYSISHLASYIALPCLLWFVPALIAPCCPCLWRGEPAWWNFVKQPESTVANIV